MPWSRNSQSTLGDRLRTLVVLSVVVAVVVAVVLETPLRGSGGPRSGLRLGSTSAAGESVQPPSDAPGTSALAAARKRKGDKRANPKGDKAKPGKDKPKGDGKGNQNQENKQGDKHKGDGKGKPKGDKGKGNKKGKGNQNKKDNGNQNKKDKQGNQDKQTPERGSTRATGAPLTPVADARVSEARPTNNYGSSSQLLVDGGADPDVASYLRFDVTGVSGTVQQATLRLWVRPDGGTQNGPEVRATGSGWTESGLTWNTRPAPSGSALDDKGKLSGGAWVEYNVTAAVTGNGPVAFVLLPQTSDGAVFDAREGANRPQLVISSGSGTPTPTPTPGPNPTPTPTPSPSPTPPGSNVSFPVRATFYYPWFPHAWTQGGVYPYTNYEPSLGYYDGGDSANIRKHLAAMQYGGIEMGIASWWGVGEHTDKRIPALLSASAGTGFRWSLYYEDEGFGNPSVEQLRADLTYIRDNYASDPSYARIDGKFVVFVYNADDSDCAVSTRWKQANTVGAYVVLKVLPGYKTCSNQPQSWHQYAPAVASDSQAGYSYAISPGFWQKDRSVRLERNLSRWQQNVRDMVASGASWQLVTTFNEWGEGTSVESATEWENSSGYGAYLEALHRDGQP
jgi:hypothetical protein